MLVTGDREMQEGMIAVRSRSGGDLGAQSVDEFIRNAVSEVERKGR
jgi:threonyl-tRNA synthetase